MATIPIVIHAPQLTLLRGDATGLFHWRHGSCTGDCPGGGPPLKDPSLVPDADRDELSPGLSARVRSSEERVGVGAPAGWLVLGGGFRYWEDFCGAAVAGVITKAAGVAVPAGAVMSANETAGGSGVDGGI